MKDFFRLLVEGPWYEALMALGLLVALIFLAVALVKVVQSMNEIL